MNIRLTRTVLSLFILCFLVVVEDVPAYAVVAGQSQSEQIMREQQFRQREDRERMESHRPATNLQMPAPAVPAGKGAGCWNINTIEVTGAANMPESMQEKITRDYAHRCLGVTEVEALLSDITRYYVDKGYTTSRAYLPQQDLTTKILKIEVVEGKIGEIKRQPGDKGSIYLPNAFPGVEGKVLNLRDIEQGLDQLNRLPSNNATVDIAPGANPGESIVTIRNTPARRFHLSGTADNYGSRSTGEQQASGTVGLDDVFGINDLWSLTVRRSSSIEDWTRYSESENGFVSIPYGYVTFTAGWAGSHYESHLITAGPTLRLNGDSRSAFFETDAVVYRDQDRKVTVTGTLTSKRQETDIANSKLDVSSRPLTILDLGANMSGSFAGGSSSLGIIWSQGLDVLGAYRDPDGLPDDAPHAQFNKFTVNASWAKPFQAYGENMTWSSTATIQRAFEVLYGTEQMSVGGAYTVRGFYEEQLANDNGAFIRDDLSLRRNVGTLWGQDMTFKPYIAFDGGFVVGQTNATPHGAILGSGLGMSLGTPTITFELFSGRPVVSAASLGNVQGFHTFGRLTVNF